MAHRAPRPRHQDHPGRTGPGCLLIPGAVILLAAAGMFAATLLIR